jgi:TPR repeat protein
MRAKKEVQDKQARGIAAARDVSEKAAAQAKQAQAKVAAQQQAEKEKRETASRIANLRDQVTKLLQAEPKDAAKIVTLLEQGASLGDVESLNMLGIQYYAGGIVPKDNAKACEWFQKAATQGHGQAMCNMGIILQEVAGSSGDRGKAAEAFSWFQKSADAGDSLGMLRLAACLQDGEGTTKDKETGFKWMMKSASAGNSSAMFNVALCYYNGTGVTKNPAKAEEWCKMAAAAGNQNAKQVIADAEAAKALKRANTVDETSPLSVANAACRQFINQGIIISAQFTGMYSWNRGLKSGTEPPQDATQILVHYVFNFQTQAGLNRTFNGYVVVSRPRGAFYSVVAANIDGQERDYR